jgi:hypothetical protein
MTGLANLGEHDPRAKPGEAPFDSDVDLALEKKTNKPVAGAVFTIRVVEAQVEEWS